MLHRPNQPAAPIVTSEPIARNAHVDIELLFVGSKRKRVLIKTYRRTGVTTLRLPDTSFVRCDTRGEAMHLLHPMACA